MMAGRRGLSCQVSRKAYSEVALAETHDRHGSVNPQSRELLSRFQGPENNDNINDDINDSCMPALLAKGRVEQPQIRLTISPYNFLHSDSICVVVMYISSLVLPQHFKITK